MLLAACLAVASLVQEAPVVEAEQATPPVVLTAQQVMDRVRVRAEGNGIARNGLTWTKTKTVYDTEDVHGEHVHETVTWRMWVRALVTWQQRTTKNGKPVKNGKPEPPDANLAAGLITWFNYRLDEKPVQPEPVTGIPCWVIHFTPSGHGEPDGMMEEVASRMHGTMYIDEHGFWIRSASGKLAEPYRKFLVINASRVTFVFEQAEELGAVITRRLEVKFVYSVMFSETAQRHVYTYTGFGLDSPAPAP